MVTKENKILICEWCHRVDVNWHLCQCWMQTFWTSLGPINIS